MNRLNQEVRPVDTLFPLLVAVVVGSCATHTPPLAVAIHSLKDTVVFQRDPGATSFNVTAVVQNRDSRPVYVVGCGPSAQRDIGGTWTTVFIPACIQGSSWMVPSGDSVMIPVILYGFTTANMLPRLDSRAGPGRYRLLFSVAPTAPSLGPTSPSSVQQVASSPFILRD
jgi:hypothetical protein